MGMGGGGEENLSAGNIVVCSMGHRKLFYFLGWCGWGREGKGGGGGWGGWGGGEGGKIAQIAHLWIGSVLNHGTDVNESRLTYEGVVSHI